MGSNSDPDHVLDCSGALCPEPVLRARRVLAGMDAGEILEVVATDPLAELDLKVFCEQTGHEMVHVETSREQVRVRIRVNSGPR